MPVGTATINFGAGLGNDTVTITVSGQTTIASTSSAEAFFMGDVTADHTADEHYIASSQIKLTCGNIQPGASFDIIAMYDSTYGPGWPTGSFTVHWVWV